MASDTQALDRLAHGLNQRYVNGGIQARATLHGVNFFSGIHWAPQFLPGAPTKQRNTRIPRPAAIPPARPTSRPTDAPAPVADLPSGYALPSVRHQRRSLILVVAPVAS